MRTVDQVLILKLKNASLMMLKEELIIEVTMEEDKIKEEMVSSGIDLMKMIHQGEARCKGKV